jgi:hypothetical protein
MVITAIVSASVVIIFIFFFMVSSFNVERERWEKEREILLDRIQAPSFVEFKSQERADQPKDKKEKPKGYDFL